MSTDRPEDSPGSDPIAPGDPKATPVAGSDPTSRQEAWRRNPDLAAKSLPEMGGDLRSHLGKSLSTKARDGLGAGVDNLSQQEGMAGSAARGVKATQRAIEMGRSAIESAKAIGASAKGLVAALGNPYTWIAILVVVVLVFITLVAITGVQVYGKNDAVENCTADGSVGGVTVPADATVEQNRDAMMDWLMRNNFASNGGKPLTKEQAAGIAGNFAAESGFGFDVTEGHVMDGASNEQVDAWTRGGPRGLGMAQWTWNPGRAGTLIELARSMGKNWFDAEVQFQMIHNEMDGAYGSRLASAGFFAAGKKPGELAIIFHDIYEGSADDAAKKARRSQMAEDAYANANVGGYNPSGGDNCQSNSPSGDWVYPVEMRNGEPLNWVTRFGSQRHESGAMDINGDGNGGAPTDWPVYAASDGVVLTIGDDNCQGITIWHEKDNVASLYLHMNSKIVKAGDTVKAGQQIGGIGTKGCGSTGNHLHFEILPENRYDIKMGAWKYMTEKGVNMGKCVGDNQAACQLSGANFGG